MYIDDNDVEVSPLGSFLVIVFMIFPVSVIIRAEYLSIKYEKKQNMYSAMVDHHCWLELWGILSHTQYTLFSITFNRFYLASNSIF